jgi:hypothetical protein
VVVHLVAQGDAVVGSKRKASRPGLYDTAPRSQWLWTCDERFFAVMEACKSGSNVSPLGNSLLPRYPSIGPWQLIPRRWPWIILGEWAPFTFRLPFVTASSLSREKYKDGLSK